MFTLVACDAEQLPEEEPGYIVRFETNGAEPMEDLKTLRIETEPYVLYEGHVFEGWYLDSDFTATATFPLNVENDMTLYAKWLQIACTEQHMDAALKLDFNHDSTMIANVTPKGLDFELLQSKGYDCVCIQVTYTLSYEKDYKLPIGYAGAPNYGVALLCSDFDKEFDKDFGLESNFFSEVPGAPSDKMVSYTINITDIGPKKVMLIFNTLNIQNIVYIKNIEVTYTAQKSGVN